jgi:hypothetical protein
MKATMNSPFLNPFNSTSRGNYDLLLDRELGALLSYFKMQKKKNSSCVITREHIDRQRQQVAATLEWRQFPRRQESRNQLVELAECSAIV